MAERDLLHHPFPVFTALRQQQSRDWLAEQLRLIDSAIEHDLSSLRRRHAEALQERKAEIRQRLSREMLLILARDGPFVENYLRARPDKRRMIAHLIDMSPHPTSKQGGESKQSAFDHDFAAMKEVLVGEGIAIDKMVLWADGELWYRGKFLRPGEEIGIQMNPELLVPVTIDAIHRTEMRLKHAETRCEIFVTPDDLTSEKYILLT